MLYFGSLMIWEESILLSLMVVMLFPVILEDYLAIYAMDTCAHDLFRQSMCTCRRISQRLVLMN